MVHTFYTHRPYRKQRAPRALACICLPSEHPCSGDESGIVMYDTPRHAKIADERVLEAGARRSWRCQHFTCHRSSAQINAPSHASALAVWRGTVRHSLSALGPGQFPRVAQCGLEARGCCAFLLFCLLFPGVPAGQTRANPVLLPLHRYREGSERAFP